MALLSKAGKVIYLCAVCRSPEIAGFMGPGHAKSYACNPCGEWRPWASRLKVSLKRAEKLGGVTGVDAVLKLAGQLLGTPASA